MVKVPLFRHVYRAAQLTAWWPWALRRSAVEVHRAAMHLPELCLIVRGWWGTRSAFVIVIPCTSIVFTTPHG